MSSSHSPSRASPGSSKPQLLSGGTGGVSRLRSSCFKKPPEPLRRAVADCLSSSSLSSVLHQGNPSVVVSEASRTLRDYLAANTTVDLAYCVIVEHTIAERERSPAVVARCIALLKRNLLRYIPSEETLLQIDRFCVNTIVECDVSPNRRFSPWSRSLSQQPSVSSATTDLSSSVSSFASGILVKSLNYVRSLVSLHIPRRSFQPAAFVGGSLIPRQSIPSLSSLLSRSFNTQLSPANVGESVEKKDATTLTISNSSNVNEVEGLEDLEYIAPDVLKWRWLGKHHSSSLNRESDYAANFPEITHNFLEAGAAALLVGEAEAKKDQPWKRFGTADMPYLDQLLQPSSVATITNSVSARSHLRAITASKRTKAGPRQIWDDSPMSTFRPRARPLFHYRHYSEQQPLRLNSAELSEVIGAVSSETLSSNSNLMTVSSRLSNTSGKPSMDVAVSVLIKLVVDMYVSDSGTAAPLALIMLKDMLGSPKVACRVRVFDLILNLGVHAQLLEPMMIDDISTIEEEYSQGSSFDTEVQLTSVGESGVVSAEKLHSSSAIDRFEMWILHILHEILLLLVQTEEKEESVWASALSCLLYFVCDRGKIRRRKLKGLDIRVIKELIETSRKNSWAEVVHSKLICLLTNMFYKVSDGHTRVFPSTPLFLVEQTDLIGGIEFILLEYSLANTTEERRNLYLILFDYVLHQAHQAFLAAGVSEYNDDEIQPLAVLLSLADAPEAFYISVKLGAEGIGELLRRSVSVVLSRYPNSERLNLLLGSMMEKFDTIIGSFTHLDNEFSHQIQITKSFKMPESVARARKTDVGVETKLSYVTLHTLLHSERIAYRRNGHIWLGDLLIDEIGDENNTSKWQIIKDLQHNIAYAGVSEPSNSSDVPLSIWLMCGLLKSKNSRVRWGFLSVLEKLLMRCKFLLDENEMLHSGGKDVHPKDEDNRLEKANAVLDVMSSALSLVAQMNETDHINILKMCDILFSQLCLKVPSASSVPYGDRIVSSRIPNITAENIKTGATLAISQQEIFLRDEFIEDTDSISNYNIQSPIACESASMAAMLLRGQAVVPMQLIARVPTALFDWPLIQLAGAVTDNIALGIAVGSKGRGNIPGATSDIRATLLLLLIGKCTADHAAFEEVGGEEFFRELLDDTDSRVAYYSSAFLLKRMMTEEPEKYQHMLQNLVFKAQQSNNEKLLENPYLQMRGIIRLCNDLGTGF